MYLCHGQLSNYVFESSLESKFPLTTVSLSGINAAASLVFMKKEPDVSIRYNLNIL